LKRSRDAGKALYFSFWTDFICMHHALRQGVWRGRTARTRPPICMRHSQSSLQRLPHSAQSGPVCGGSQPPVAATSYLRDQFTAAVTTRLAARPGIPTFSMPPVQFQLILALARINSGRRHR
jgi:hypothetical protein